MIVMSLRTFIIKVLFFISIPPFFLKIGGQHSHQMLKKKCKQKVDKIVIYCTDPIKKVVAEVLVEDLISNTPIKVWNITKEYAGISKIKYMQYFANTEVAYAYKLSKIKKYDVPKTLEELGINYYPQSYVYLDD